MHELHSIYTDSCEQEEQLFALCTGTVFVRNPKKGLGECARKYLWSAAALRRSSTPYSVLSLLPM
jgi:hypothetical protein